ncbi:hypothetical protein HMPREF1205_00295 [Bacteroides fragilis HMW 616]|nr:hypothetical protein HMPREF1205_00295 [Bacteroides fragilis HMW 616]
MEIEKDFINLLTLHKALIYLKSATIIQYTIKGRFMSR